MLSRVKSGEFKILDTMFCWAIAAPKSVWTYRMSGTEHRHRVDALIGLERIYGYEPGMPYLYTLTIGRFRLTFWKNR